MSGGSFDYNCFRISQFADELKHKMDVNDDETLNEWNEMRGRFYSEEVVEVLKYWQARIEQAGKAAREIEWLYSGDHGEESFMRLMERIEE